MRSLDVKPDGTLLAGTRGATVLEISPQQQASVVVQGHYRGVNDLPEVWGCAVHPTKQIFASAGADRYVRLWDATKKMEVSQQFQNDVTALSWSPNGQFIAVGDRLGYCIVLDAATLQVLGNKKTALSGKNKHTWVEDVKFSPCSSKIAIGTHGGRGKVQVITLASNGKPTSIHDVKVVFSSAVIAMDWSLDGQVIECNSQAAELYWGNANGQGDVKASGAKNLDFATKTCRFAWDTIGMWQGVDFSDINTCDRSHNRTLLATGDDFGQVNLFKYPCVMEKSNYGEYFGHSSHVTKVRFSANDEYIVSTGGNDLTVMVWQTDINEGADNQDQEQIEYDENPDDPD
jgi:microtubule-associated protein-like 6